MSHSLDAKQYVPLTTDEQMTLRAEAAKRDISTGLLARALLTQALDNIDDPTMAARISEEKLASKARITSGARTAVSARWGTGQTTEKKP